MDHRLVPEFILRQVGEERYAGNFQAVCLLVDLSGFTAFTGALLVHGVEGAEVIAESLSTIFEPLVEIVYRHGGFVAAFAGDAFTALFPTTIPDAYLCALTAAWQIHQASAKQPQQETRFGVFDFAIKVAVADGLVEWGVWQTVPPAAPTPNRQQATYFFCGEAIDRCLLVDAFAQAGTVMLTAEVYARLPHNELVVEASPPYYQMRAVADTLVAAIVCSPLAASNANDTDVTLFFPVDLLRQQSKGEFRQVATVFVNLQQLPTGPATVTFQQTLFYLLAQYGGYLSLVGRIGQADIGCTLVIFWGAPISYENNLRRALCFLRDLRHATSIPLRAGVTWNLVYAGFVGSARRQAYTCYGSYINLAARQAALADWGEILLDAATARHAQADFHVLEYGWHSLKGFSEPQQLFLLDEQQSATRPATYATPLIGRQQVFEQGWQALQPLFQGKFGGVITVMGEAGIGKSRLVYELQKRIQLATEWRPLKVPDSAVPTAREVAWFTCQADEIQQQPLSPFRHFLRSYFQQATTNSETVNKQRFTEQMDALIGATSDRALAAELDRTRSFLAALVGLQWKGSLYQQVEPQLRVHNTLDALKSFIKAASLRQPLILHLEDTHWLDSESNLFLEKLTTHVAAYPFLLILTTRPPHTMTDQQSGERLGPQMRSVIPLMLHLAPLSRTHLETLATYWLEGKVTVAVVDLLFERAAGNPFFTEQILRYLQDHELLAWSDQGWQLTQANEALMAMRASPLPATVHMILTARLDRLPQPVKEVVQTAAVLGQTFDLRVLTRMWTGDHGQLAAYMTVAEQADIWSTGDLMQYRFRHALLRDTAYTMQLRAQQRALHSRAAEAIIEIYGHQLATHYAELIYHYRQSEDQANERYYTQLAGESAAAQYENEEAATYFSRALLLTEVNDWAARYALLLQRESVYNLLGQRPAQAQDLTELHMLAEALQDEHALQEVLLRQAYYLRVIGDYEAALAVIQEIIAWTAQHDAQAIEAKAYHAWGRILSQQGNTQAALAPLQHALRLAKTTGNQLEEAESLYDIGLVYSTSGQYELATTHYHAAFTHYQSLGAQRGEINCLLMFGVITNEQGDYPSAHQYYRQAIVRCRAIGWRHAEAYSLTNLGNNYFDFGNYDAAFTCHQSALEICREIGDYEGEAVSLDTLGLIWQNLGDAGLARTHFEQALAIQQQIGDRHGEGFTLTHLGYTLYAGGELAAAITFFQQAYELRMTLREDSHAIDSLAGLAQSALAQGDLPTAIDLAEHCLTWLRARGADGIEFPILVYLICYQTLSAVKPVPTAFVPATVLQDGYRLLQERATKIQDATLRRQFLENVWFNRELLNCWEEASQQKRERQELQLS